LYGRQQNELGFSQKSFDGRLHHRCEETEGSEGETDATKCGAFAKDNQLDFKLSITFIKQTIHKIQGAELDGQFSDVESS